MSFKQALVPFNDLGRMTHELQNEILATTAAVISSGWFVMGPEHNALEAELADFVGVLHTALVANGTDALVLALSALDVGANDLVLTCANAGGYTSNAARLVGATPVYCDVDPATLLVTLGTVQAGVAAAEVSHGRKPSCIVVTHLFGATADISAITEWAHGLGITVVEDCAQALGGFSGSERVGSIGDIATTSFYPTKNLGALGDAGAVFTNRSDLDTRVRGLRQYGWDRKYHSVLNGGMNSRCDELQAAILRLKLPHLDAWNTRRREIHARYEAALNSTTTRLVSSTARDFVGHLAVLATTDRDTATALFAEHGIKTDTHYPICDHLQPTVSKNIPTLPVSERAAEQILSVPLFPELSNDEVERVCAALREL